MSKVKQTGFPLSHLMIMNTMFELHRNGLNLNQLTNLNLCLARVFGETLTAKVFGEDALSISMMRIDKSMKVSGMTELQKRVNLLESIFYLMLKTQECLLKEQPKHIRTEFMLILSLDITSSLIICQQTIYLSLIQNSKTESKAWLRAADI